MTRGLVVAATRKDECCSIGCAHDELRDGRRFRVPTVVAQYARELLTTDAW